jgi:hypothetical protein
MTTQANERRRCLEIGTGEVGVTEDRTEQGQSPAPEEPDDHDDEHSTQGTMVLMLLFLVLTIGVWGTMFLLLLDRG